MNNLSEERCAEMTQLLNYVRITVADFNVNEFLTVFATAIDDYCINHEIDCEVMNDYLQDLIRIRTEVNALFGTITF